MGFGIRKDFWDAAPYKGDSVEHLTGSAGVSLTIYTCNMVLSQGPKHQRSDVPQQPFPLPQVTSLGVILTHLVLSLHFQASKMSLLMQNKHTKLISIK